MKKKKLIAVAHCFIDDEKNNQKTILLNYEFTIFTLIIRNL